MAKFLLTPEPIVLSPEAKAAKVQQAVEDVNLSLNELVGMGADIECMHATLDKVQAQINLVSKNLANAEGLKAICESGALEALGAEIDKEIVATEFLGDAFRALWKGIVWIYEKIKALLKWLIRFVIDSLTTLDHKVNNIKNAKSYNPTDEKLSIMSWADYMSFSQMGATFLKGAMEFSSSLKATLTTCTDPARVVELCNALAGKLEDLANDNYCKDWLQFNMETKSIEFGPKFLKAHEPKTLVEAGFPTLDRAKEFVTNNQFANGKMSGAHKRYWQGLQTAFYNAAQPPFAIFQQIKKLVDGGTSPAADQLNHAATALRGLLRLQAQMSSIQHRMEAETVKIVEALNRACSGKEKQPEGNNATATPAQPAQLPGPTTNA